MLDEQKAAVWAAFERGELDEDRATILLLRLDHHARLARQARHVQTGRGGQARRRRAGQHSRAGSHRH